MDKSRANYVSVIAVRLVEPIFTLLHRLLADPHPGSNEVQTGARENGYSASICLLLVVLLESMIARARASPPLNGLAARGENHCGRPVAASANRGSPTRPRDREPTKHGARVVRSVATSQHPTSESAKQPRRRP